MLPFLYKQSQKINTQGSNEKVIKLLPQQDLHGMGCLAYMTLLIKQGFPRKPKVQSAAADSLLLVADETKMAKKNMAAYP